MRTRSLLACALAALPTLAWADPELDALRAEIRTMKQQYETRLAELEARLAAAESRPGIVQPVSDTSGNASTFNPETSLILQGDYVSRKGGERHITGFLPAGEHAHGTERGFSLDHTELVLSANVDPLFRGYANFALADEEVEVEEAWFQTLGLGRGVTLKGGRFLSGVGYQNERHPHAWDFADNSLMYSVLFGEHLRQDGVQLKWLAPTETFLELGLEAGRGNAFPGSDDGGDLNGAGAWAAFAHLGGDVGASHSWRAGLSFLRARPENRAGELDDTADVETETTFSGRSKAWLADFVWKWAPDGNARYRNLKFQAEWFRRSEDGVMSCADQDPLNPGDTCDGDPSDIYRTRQSGWYAQGVWQFMPAWRVGIRYDRLDGGSVSFGALPFATPGYNPSKYSLMVDWSPSEFSRLRLQLARDKSMQGDPDNQVTLQYIMSLGSHGAHKF